ncbi:MAG: PHP domain-containing protein, partial [Promethearchaeota archaeon]
DYRSQLPLIRYLIEPIVGISFIIGYDFEYLIAFTTFYFIYRILYLYLKKSGRISSTRFRNLETPVYNFMSFIFKIFSVTVLLIAITILIGYLLSGYYFVSRYFMVIVQLGIRVCFGLLIIKVSHFVIILLHPKLKFKNLSGKKRTKSKKIWRFSRYSGKIKMEIIYLASIISILIGTNILLISTKFPTQKLKADLGPNEFLFDFHVHTTMSDGWISPEQRIDWYVEQGIQGAVFTDHDNLRGAFAARKYVETNGLDFEVWVGAEWTDNEKDIHMNYYGVEEEIVAPMSENPTGNSLVLNASDMIKYVKSKGGYVIVNHYSDPPGFPYTYVDLAKWGVDGFEIVNGDHIEEREIREFCLNNTNSLNQSLICIGGSDIHTTEDLNAFVKMKLDDPTNKTIDNIFRILRFNNHSVITIKFLSDTVNFPGELNDFGFKLIEHYLNYLFNLNGLQVFSWIVWSGASYTLLFLAYRRIRKSGLGKVKTKASEKQ